MLPGFRQRFQFALGIFIQHRIFRHNLPLDGNEICSLFLKACKDWKFPPPKVFKKSTLLSLKDAFNVLLSRAHVEMGFSIVLLLPRTGSDSIEPRVGRTLGLICLTASHMDNGRFKDANKYQTLQVL